MTAQNNQSQPRKAKRVDDALRRAWLSFDFAIFNSLAREGAVATAPTCRKLLAPAYLSQIIGRNLSTKDCVFENAFCESFLLLCTMLPASLAARPDIAGQLQANGSLSLAATLLAQPSGILVKLRNSKFELFDKAFSSLCSCSETLLSSPCAFATRDATGRVSIRLGSPLWTLAAMLPPESCSFCLRKACEKSLSDPKAAWEAFVSQAKRPCQPESLALCAQSAQSPDEEQLSKTLMLLALAALDERSADRRIHIEKAIRALCQGSPAIYRIKSEWICGCDFQNAELARFHSPMPFAQKISSLSRLRQSEPEPNERAARILNHFEACARLGAELDLADLSASSNDTTVGRCFASLSKALDSGALDPNIRNSPFGASDPNFSEAYNRRKLHHRLNIELPISRKSLRAKTDSL